MRPSEIMLNVLLTRGEWVGKFEWGSWWQLEGGNGKGKCKVQESMNHDKHQPDPIFPKCVLVQMR